MKIHIKIHPSSSQEKVVKISEDEYGVWIKEKPINGKANIYLEKYLKKYFGKSVRIISGFSSKNKIIEIEE